MSAKRSLPSRLLNAVIRRRESIPDTANTARRSGATPSAALAIAATAGTAVVSLAQRGSQPST